MTYMLIHALLGVKNIDKPLVYVASIWHTSKGTETALQYESVTLETIVIEVNEKCFKLLIMRSTKLNIASF